MLDTEIKAWPFERRTAMAMPEEYPRLRAEQPIVRVKLTTGQEAWLVTRFDDVTFVLSDSRFSPRQPAGPLGPEEPGSSSLFQDPPGHTRLRGLVARAFTARRVAALRPFVRRLCHHLTDDLVANGAPADLMSAFAFRVPVDSIAELLGVPQPDRGRFRDRSTRLITAGGEDLNELRATGLMVYGMIADLVADRRENPADDLMSALIAVRDDDDRLTEDELVTMGMTLLTAGFVATANTIGLGVVLLAGADGFGRMHDDPSLIPGAVEEVLRYAPKVGGPARMAKEDVALHGVLIRAGELVVAPEQCGNRDERRFEDPETFRIDRENNNHIAFGHGIHHCLGATLARLQLREAFGVLSERLPELRPACPVDDLAWSMNFFGDNRFGELPVTW